MLDYIQRYQNLPQEIRDKLSAVEVMSAINQMEEQFGIDLANVVMKIMVKEISIDSLAAYFVFEYNFDPARADELTEKIISRVLSGVSDYLNIKDKSAKPITKEPELVVVLPEVKKEVIKPADPSASFYFSPEDEEEIREITKSIDNLNTEDKNKEIDSKIEKIISKAGIVFSSSFMSDRFLQIMRTYLRGIRDKIEIIQALTRPFANGGLGLDQSAIDKIMLATNEIFKSSEVDEKRADLLIEPETLEKPIDNDNFFDVLDADKAKAPAEKSKVDVFAALKNIGMRDYEYDLAKELEKKKVEQKKLVESEVAPVAPVSEVKKEIIPEKTISTKKTESQTEEFIENLNVDHELMPPTPAVISVSAVIPPKAELFNGAKVVSIKPQMVTPDKPKVALTKEPSVKIEQEPAKKINFIRPVNIDGKVKMEDVKYVPYVLDQVDELRYFNLINFRRLSTDAKVAAGKIKEKIELLQKEKYSKGFEAIKAWRESPISKLYIQMGHECIENRINIDEVIKRRRAAGEDFLEMAEFDAILDLNKSLRY